MNNEVGLIYLLHFDRPLAHSNHYVGWCGNGNLVERLRRHNAGVSRVKFLIAAKEAGIKFELVRTWVGTRELERKIKNSKAVGRLYCPQCKINRRNK